MFLRGNVESPEWTVRLLSMISNVSGLTTGADLGLVFFLLVVVKRLVPSSNAVT